jgi:hypothetical protein
MPCRNANGRRRLKDRMIFNDLALQPINPNRYGSHEPDARSVTVQVPVNAFLQHIPLPRAARNHSRPRLVELHTPATSDPTHRYFDAAIHDLHTALTFFTPTLTATTSFFLDSIASLHCNTSTRNIHGMIACTSAHGSTRRSTMPTTLCCEIWCSKSALSTARVRS